MKKTILFMLLFSLVACVVGLVIVTIRKKSIDSVSSLSQPVTSITRQQAKDAVEPIEIPEVAVIPSQSEPLHNSVTTPSVMPQFQASIVSIPENLKTFMGQGQKKSYAARKKVLHEFNRSLSHDEVQTLFLLLNRKKGEDDLPLSQLNALKDSVANLLEKQKYLDDFSNNFMAMYYDQGHDVVWRDYCVQHLGTWFSREADSKRRKSIADLFWLATAEKNSTIGGTALISLIRNKDAGDISVQAIADRAFELVQDPQCGNSTKTSALQICSQLNDSRILSMARQISNSRKPVPLRISALAAIGALGGESDNVLLLKNASSRDHRLSTAAKSALKRLGLKSE